MPRQNRVSMVRDRAWGIWGECKLWRQIENERFGSPNLVPRVSLLCLPWSLEERPWLRLVTWPPRIWVAKKCVGWEGWQSILFGWCDKLCALQILSKQSLNTARSFGVRSRICRWWMLHDFCRLQNIEDFRSQRNSAAEWSRNVLTVSKCERSRTGSKWNQWISLLNLWIRR